VEFLLASRQQQLAEVDRNLHAVFVCRHLEKEKNNQKKKQSS
jgi:hypothetical protein